MQFQILRLKKVEDAFIKSLKQLDADVFVVRMIRSATQVAMFLQISACLWFAIAGCSVAVDGEMKCSEHTWMEKRLIEEQHNDADDGHAGNHSILLYLDVGYIIVGGRGKKFFEIINWGGL